MQIVIEIEKQIYENAKNDLLCGAGIIINAIKNGTPLPEHHGRLIDADKTISKICGSSCGCHLEECGHDEPCFSVVRIKSAQTIIPATKEGE